jgi:hypothetical protein
METTTDLLKVGRTQEIWTKHCGFVNISLEEFMEIQHRLLAEQIDLLKNSQLGKEILKGKIPGSTEEFRSTVPITTYEDYAHYLEDKNEDVLPVKPYAWSRTSGRTSQKGPKWVPYSKKMYDLLGDSAIGAMIMSSCRGKGDINLQLRDKLLLSVAPPPYVSGYLAYSTRDQLDVKFFPDLEEGEQMEFAERLAKGFNMAMKEGLDYFYGVASILVAMGERFEESSESAKPSMQMLNPFVLWRLIKAVVKTRIQNRNLLPKDIWKLKGIMAGGTDCEIYKDKIEYYWGHQPLEGYASTEGGTMACQAWNYNGMIFFPDRAFLEFIPYEEQNKSISDPEYQPKTVLFNELKPGVYELVFTNFHGGVYTRYRVGDMFEVISVGDREVGSELPQVRFYSRNSDIIDLAGIVRITEKDIWRIVEETEVPYVDWVVRKEYTDGASFLHLYIEPKDKLPMSKEELQIALQENLINQVSDYQDYQEMVENTPFTLTILPSGAFGSYMKAQQEAGADLAHVKPPHIQPFDSVIERLLSG